MIEILAMMNKIACSISRNGTSNDAIGSVSLCNRIECRSAPSIYEFYFVKARVCLWHLADHFAAEQNVYSWG